MLGGYQIIDLAKNSWTIGDEPDVQTISGIYNKANSGKAVLLENVTIGAITISGAFTSPLKLENGTIVISIPLVTDAIAFCRFVIDDNDSVTFSLTTNKTE